MAVKPDQKKASHPEETSEAAALMALFGQRRFAEAERLARSMTQSVPDHGYGWKMLAAVLVQLNRPTEALQAARTAVELIPQDVDAHSNLGFVLNKLGLFAEAASCFRQAIAIKPDFAGAHYNLGNALMAQNLWTEAEASFRQAIRHAPEFPHAYFALGNALNESGRWADAEAAFRRALAIKPNFAAAHHNLGNALMAQARAAEAEYCYRRALEIAPGMLEAYCSLGSALKELGRVSEAEECCRHALAADPKLAEAYYVLGACLTQQNRDADAQNSHERALQINPDYADALVGLGDIAAGQGRFAEAETLYRRALTISPHLCTAWAAIANIRKMNADASEWMAQAEAMLRGGLPRRQESILRYAMGKVCDDMRDFEPAFAHYRIANDLVKDYGGRYDRAQHTRDIERLRLAYPRERVRATRAGASASDRPVFIVGMPRSGTSLVEQIIASHPAAFGAGELSFWGLAHARNKEAIAAGDLDETLVRRLADDCLRNLCNHSADALRVTDKMPANFSMLGLIHAAFPNARILHTMRHPVDTCISIYFQNFNASYTFANDLADLAHYYREYRKLMAHWRAVLPEDVLLEVPYEALIEDQEGWSRKMIAFLGLDWDDRCLNFHRTERKVGTSSNWQVRQGIYQTSKERWRNYEKYVGPLLDLMELDK